MRDNWVSVLITHLFSVGLMSVQHSVLNVNQEKAQVGAFSVITNLHMDLRFKLYYTVHRFAAGAD